MSPGEALRRALRGARPDSGEGRRPIEAGAEGVLGNQTGRAHAGRPSVAIGFGKYALIDDQPVHPNRVLAQYIAGGPVLPRLVTTVGGVSCNQTVVTSTGLVCLELDNDLSLPPKRQITYSLPKTARERQAAAARGDQILAHIKSLEAAGKFRFVEPDFIIPVNATPMDKAFVEGKLWGLHNPSRENGKPNADIDAVRAWNLSVGSSDVVVAVIDTGIRHSHNDLKNQMWVNTDEIPGNGKDDDKDGFVDNIFGMDAVNDDGDPMDDNGHGTHCAGTIGAEANNGHPHVGVAWKVRLMACKSISDNGMGTTADAVKCIDWAVDNGAQVLSLSWGSSKKSKSIYGAIKKAGEKGVLVVAAAGNDGENTDESPHYPSGYDLGNIISVAAINQNGRLTGWSNYGVRSVDLASPGENIFSTSAESDSEYVVLSGTSMACPHVSGVAALMLGKTPKLTPAELRAKMIHSVTRATGLRGKVGSGGWVNAYSALSPSKQRRFSGRGNRGRPLHQ